MSEIKPKVVTQVQLPQTGTFYSGNASNVSKAYTSQDTNHERSGQSPADMVICNKTEKYTIPLPPYLVHVTAAANCLPTFLH